MNILAHIYLSGGNSDLMVGNFIGDAVKGKQYLNYSNQIQKGILLHRKIDSYTDSHPLTRASKKYFSEDYGLHSGIVVDILYDHFLACNWSSYSSSSLEEYTTSAYTYLLKKAWLMPLKMQHMLPYLVESNWINLYRSLNGIHRVLHGMSVRTSVPAKAELAKSIIELNYTTLEQLFKDFFEDLQQNTRIM